MHVALLRAVNVAGHGVFAMADLRAAASALGFSGVRTVLQSGNLVFDGGARPPSVLERLLEQAIADRLNVQTQCLVRTAEEWATLVAANPYPDAARVDPARLVVMCLKSAPEAPAIARLRNAIRGPESVHAAGREIYIRYPAGIGQSKLTGAVIERTLATRGTARNWNTVLKLAALVHPT